MTDAELAQRDAVIAAVMDAIRTGTRILLPKFDPERASGGADFALQAIVNEANPFGGSIGPYRYQFEGEDDLLHVFVVRADGGVLSPQEGQRVFSLLLPDLPTALVWLKPGTVSQHFYFGHDELLYQQQIEANVE